MHRFFFAIYFIITVCSFCVKTQAQNISAGTPTGSITACLGSASGSPNLQQFSVTGTGLTGNITATSPAGFEVSLSADGGYGNSVVLVLTGGTVNKMVYVRSAANAALGNISGDVLLTSAGAAIKNVAVSGVVNALPTVNTTENQTWNSGMATAPVNFTGTSTAYRWVCDKPDIGIAASGTGDIPSFKAINTTTTAVTATFTVTPVPTGFAYTANATSADVSVISLGDNKVESTIHTGDIPVKTLVSADGGSIYVITITQDNTNRSGIAVIDSKSNVLTNLFEVKGYISDVQISPDGKRLYVTDLGNGCLYFLDATTGVILNTILNITAPRVSLLSADGSRLYVTSLDNGNLYVINTVTNLIQATFAFNNCDYMLLSPDGSRLYAVGLSDGIVAVLNTVTDQLVTSVVVGGSPTKPSITPDGALLYLPNQAQNYVSVINTATNTVIKQITVGGYCTGTAITADGRYVYAINALSQNVSLISTLTNTVVATISLPGYLGPPYLSTDGSRLYIPDGGTNILHAINTATNTVIDDISAGKEPALSDNSFSKGNGCSGIPITFTITVKPPVPTITVTGAPNAVNTSYGTASVSSSFTVSGTSLSSAILITPPDGFEISTDNVNFSKTLALGNAGDLAATTVHIRLTQIANAGKYSGDIVLGSLGASDVNVSMPTSIVSRAIINAYGTYSKIYGDELADLTLYNNVPGINYDLAGLKNGNTFVSIDFKFIAGTTATSGAGNYKNAGKLVSFVGGNGFIDGNYTINYAPFDLIVEPARLIITAKDINKPYGVTLSDMIASGNFTVDGLKNNETVTGVNIAYTAGAASSATPGLYAGSVVASGAAGGTFNAGNYVIEYKPGNLNVEAAPVPVITATNAPSPLSTIYGTASDASSFTILGTNLTGGILVTPPAGFEVSTDNSTFGSTVMVGATGSVINQTVYIRLASTTNVSVYTGNINLSSAGAADGHVAMPPSFVLQAPLTIKVTDRTKPYGTALTNSISTTGFTISSGGLKNGNTINSVTITYGAGKDATALVNTFTGSVVADGLTGGNGFLPNNYAVDYLQGDLTVTAVELIITADNKNKAFGADVPALTVNYSGFVNNETEVQLSVKPVITTTALRTSPQGDYPIIAKGAVANNYTIKYVAGVLTVAAPPPVLLTIPNAFTPNADGVNDTWLLTDLASFPDCSVNVFNRYGQRVFSSVGYSVAWDGRYKGIDVPSGTYYYIIDPKSNLKVYSGSIVVIR